MSWPCHVSRAFAAAVPLVLFVMTTFRHSAAVIRAGQQATTPILFFDDHHLASAENVVFEMGSVQLVSEFRDPTSYVGWGYPSVWRPNGTSGGFRMIYQGWHIDNATGKVDTKLMLMAQSDDGVAWSAAELGGVCLVLRARCIDRLRCVAPLPRAGGFMPVVLARD